MPQRHAVFGGPKNSQNQHPGGLPGNAIMTIFTNTVTLDSLNAMAPQTMAGTLGIEFTAFGEDYLEARMPVDHRTRQPLGLLHGGASVALAETLGSVAASCCIDRNTSFCVGLEINANHLRSVREGYVRGRTRPVHIGKTTHVWEIRIVNEATDDLVCVSRITLAILERRNKEQEGHGEK